MPIGIFPAYSKFHFPKFDSRMKSPKTLLLVAALSCFAYSASGQTIFEMSTVSGSTFEHDSDGTNNPSPLPNAGSEATAGGVFSWGNLLTDTTPNTATFSGTTFTSTDWGGNGTYTSTTISINTLSSVTINAVGNIASSDLGSDTFNFFYQLDDGSQISFADTLSNLNVAGIDNLIVGFTYNMNGASDIVTVSELSVVPEPGTYALLSGICALGFVMLNRRN